MWRPQGAVTLDRMTAAGEPRRLGLEVRFDAEPIQGRLYDASDGHFDRRFSGWMGLMAALEAVRTAEPQAARSTDREGEAR